LLSNQITIFSVAHMMSYGIVALHSLVTDHRNALQKAM